ncbi:hypothetical protein GGTG_12827 [Gaeumannomyces tritici R3-111a-1]|uniref:Uncharacterized protein n=1 Tax=Gaeumannomyces tritici (strain R3-111a-1) TaxID=644352 RepID=J3PH47_GAET3|nr:hypothetical protein GGTG_12827 [Gaeumannomyces tritici R3-111a-1]EJT69944.1 hypothetical protein GGTG_12827 [Gaeumannomyces tritici R3-111a-1]
MARYSATRQRTSGNECASASSHWLDVRANLAPAPAITAAKRAPYRTKQET